MSHWSFVLMGLHLGMHIPAMMSGMKRQDKTSFIPACLFTVLGGIGRSGPNMAALAGSGTWLDGKRFSGNVSEADLKSWIESLK